MTEREVIRNFLDRIFPNGRPSLDEGLQQILVDYLTGVICVAAKRINDGR